MRHLAQAAALALLLLVVAAGPRLAGLGEATTEDEDQWMARSGGFAQALASRDWRATFQIGHPGVTTMWVAVLGLGLERAREFAPAERSERLVTQHEDFKPALEQARRGFVLANAALVAGCGLLARRLFGSGPGVLAGLLLALEPYWAGMSPIVGLDGLLSGLLGGALLSALLAFRRLPDAPGIGWALLSGWLAGLALLTKGTALFLLPLIPLLGLLALPADLRQLAGWRPVLLRLVLWGAGLLVAGAIWPAIWVDPLGTVRRTLSFVYTTGTEPHAPGNFFLGQPVDDPGPLFYPVALALRAGPAVLVGLGLLVALGTPRIWREPFGLLAGFVALFLLGLSLSPKKIDRYVLPLWPSLGLLAGVGWWRLAERLGRLGPAVAALIVALELWPLVGAWPHLLAAYDPLVGGSASAARALPVGWGEGLDSVGSQLRLESDPEGLTTAIWYPLFVNFQAEAPGRVVNLRFGGPGQVDPRDRRLLDESQYFVDYISARQRGLVPSELLGRTPSFVVTINGLEYARVYRLR
jgi:hypothetical protein